MDAVFKALADPSRRELLDRLNARNGQSLGELCEGLVMARQSVTKHLAVLEAANLVTTSRRGRQKLHHLNTAPINDIADRWIGRYDRPRAQALADLRRALEDSAMDETEFVYSTYIKTTPEQLWRALTEPAFTLRYWGSALHSDWQVGSPVLWQTGEDGAPEDRDQVVLESEPYRRLAYTWHTFQPEHADRFGWSEERLAELVKEQRSRVSFDIEPAGPVVKLTVTHDGFAPGSEMLRAVSGRNPESGGWPELLAGLKTLLETGETLDAETTTTAGHTT
ncbi:MAG TPA: metalloregulator ArsR/SmtB family transcription factor [Acidimicrobiales bacterium]|nr:metalloregulator ArsR/SmtB family transcription factor [Acidimicrobiales bacterium]